MANRRFGGMGGHQRGNRPFSKPHQPFQVGASPWQGNVPSNNSMNQGDLLGQLASNPQQLALALTSLVQAQQQQMNNPPSLLSLNTSPPLSQDRNSSNRFGGNRGWSDFRRNYEPHNNKTCSSAALPIKMGSSDQAWFEDLLVELECPVCTNYMSPPITQCATGHNICCKCRNKLTNCPLCKGKFTDSRNLSLEGLACKIRYPCINKHLGCTAQLSHSERDLHELRCPLKRFSCAMDKCSWAGKLDELLAHWSSKKIKSKPYNRSNVCHTIIKAESYYVNIVSAYSNLFWFKCKLIKNKLFWAVQLIGNSSDADNYYYEIEIFKPGRPARKIMIGDYCQPIDLDNSQLFNGETCISINTETIQN